VKWPSGVAVSEGGAVVAIGSLASRIEVWDGGTGELSRTLLTGAGVRSIAMFRGGDGIVAFTASDAAIWDVDTGERIMLLDGAAGGEQQTVVISDDSSVIAACGGVPRWWEEQQATFWDALTGQRLHTILGEEQARPHARWLTSVVRPRCSIALSAAGAAS